MKKIIYSALVLATLSMTSCSDFLDEHTPQATLSDEQVKEANHVDELVTSAYAIFISAEDINSSFSMWNTSPSLVPLPPL